MKRAIRRLAAPLVLTIAMAASHGARAGCELRKVSSLAVKVEGNRPFVDGTLDGKPIRALIETGVTVSFLMRPSAERLELDRNRIYGARSVGIGGPSRFDRAHVDRLELGIFHAEDISVPVTGEAPRPYDFLIGRDLLGGFDIEFDLSHGMVNLFRPKDCGDAALAYWGGSWSSVALQKDPALGNKRSTGPAPYRVKVAVNGVPLTAQLDSGSSTSVLTLRGAEKAGVTPSSPGVEPLGTGQGIGKRTIQEWRATFDSFSIGDETIYSPKLCLADLYQHTPGGVHLADAEPDMILGADFFEAHRLYIANSQHKLYFTHGGGPVFRVVYQEDEDPDETSAQ